MAYTATIELRNPKIWPSREGMTESFELGKRDETSNRRYLSHQGISTAEVRANI